MAMGQTKRISLEDVARAANVSRSTVSLVLNKAEGQIPLSDESIRRVRDAVRQLGYKPNVFARGLASGHSRLHALAVVLPNEQVLGSEVNAQVLTGLSSTATQHQFICSLLVPSSNPGQAFLDHPLFREKLVEGVVAFCWERVEQDHLREFEEQNMPFVALHMEVAGRNVASVNIDDFGNGYQTAKHLLECGYQEIVFVGGPTVADAALQRQAGVRKCLEEHGLTLPKEKIVPGTYYDIDEAAFKSLLGRLKRPVGVVAVSDRLAVTVIHWIKTMGFRIPQDYGIVGFDDAPSAAFQDPPLTTIRQDGFEQGAIAAKMVLDMIAGKPVNRNVILPGKLITRSSTVNVFP